MIKTLGLAVAASLAFACIPADAFLLIGPQASGGGSAVTPLCSVSGITCDYAYSMTHQMVATATKAFQLNNGTTTHDVGFGPAHIQGGVHQNGGSSSTTVAVTLPSTVQAGSMVACLIGVPSSASSTPLTGVTDDKSNTYTIVDSAKDTVDNYWWNTAYRLNITNAPETITATLGSSLTFATIICDGYSGVVASAALDGHAINYQPLPTTATDAVTSGTATSAANGDLVYGGTVNVSGSGTITAGTGETQRQSVASAFMSEDKIQATAGAVASTFTSSASTPYITATMNFKSAQLVNSADAKSFCSATQDCHVSIVYDQTGNGCDITNATIGLQPSFWTWGAHDALPVIALTYGASGPSPTLELTGCSTDSANLARTLIVTSNDTYSSASTGMFGKGTNTVGSVGNAAYRSLFLSGTTAGIDFDGTSFQPSYVPTGIDAIMVLTYDGAGTAVVNINGTDIGTTGSVGTLATQNRMMWGRNDAGNDYGPGVVSDMAWVSGNLDSAHRTAAYTNLNAIYSGLPAGPSAPADLFDVGVSTNTPQITFMVGGWGVRQVNAEYYGPLLNVCQGVTATCEDIGQINGRLDVATANTFCGPSNCTVQIAYNQAIQAAGTSTFNGSVLNMVAASAAARPALTFSCSGLGTGIPCMTNTGTQTICTAGNPYGVGAGVAHTLSVVSERPVSTGTAGTVLGGVDSTASQIEYAGTIGSPIAEVCNFAPVCSSLPDTTLSWHSQTGVLDNTNVVFYQDGTSASAAGTADSVYANVCLFAGVTGVRPMVGSIAEAYVFQNHAATSGEVASLRANQRAALGF